MDKKIQLALSKMLDTLSPDFYGSFTLTFQAGKLHCLKTEQTDKLIEADE